MSVVDRNDKILEVKNLRLAFRTNNGNVHAVCGINFDLYRGETLGIVGESGSGKSVTARAVLGILAGNKIVEGGEIFFEGRDLLKLTEDEFYSIRGSKISMIFQDPMSSLNPIMKVGKQLTEAMILKSKTSRQVAKKDIDITNKAILTNIKDDNNFDYKEVNKIINLHDQLLFKVTKLKHDYDYAYKHLLTVEGILDEAQKQTTSQGADADAISATFDRLISKIKLSVNEYLFNDDDEILTNIQEYITLYRGYQKSEITLEDLKSKLSKSISNMNNRLQLILKTKRPNFESLAISQLAFDKKTNDVDDRRVQELTKNSGKYKDILLAAVKKANYQSINSKIDLISYLREHQVVVENNIDKKQVKKFLRDLETKMDKAVNLLSVEKDRYFYSLLTRLNAAFSNYFEVQSLNHKAEIEAKKHNKKADVIDNTSNQELCIESFHKLVFAIQDNIDKDISLNDTVIGLEKNNQSYAEKLADVVTKHTSKQQALELMREVGIQQAEKRFNQYPFQFSGGMRQRIVIAIAIGFNPDILICDEPTTALDVTIQSQILELINRIKKERNLSVIFITHDLGVIANIADRIMVMYAGKVVEYGLVDEIFYDPRHPYTWALLSSMPDLETKEQLEAIPGTPPNMINPPKGDAFAMRNKYAMKIDFEEEPPLFRVTDTHYAKTWLLHPNAPKVDKPKIVKERIDRVNKMMGGNTNGK
jgi:oligopeptide/dipeptide ABC transporter ATP-binding protein